MFKKKIILLS